MAKAYHAFGYSGIVVTDHFFNGNCRVPHELEWAERVDCFISGYLDAKAAGDRLGMVVLFGWEFNICGAEFLTYGLDPEFLHMNPNIDRLGARDYIDLVHKAGGFISQAHPFRERDYIYGLHLYPTCEGAEVVNLGNRDIENRRAHEYAEDRSIIMTAGGDLHSANAIDGTGMMFYNEIKNSADFIEALRLDDYKLILRGKSL